MKNCGYQSPTQIQTEAIPSVLEGRDIIACAQTGTGKTAAFLIPSLQHLLIHPPCKQPKILVLAPTRELANQITQSVKTYGKFVPCEVANLVGGESYFKQIKSLSFGAQIVVATPGRLLDHLKNKRLNLSQIDILILDEADRMLDMGFVDDIQFIAKRIPSTRQTLLFTATIDQNLTKLSKQLLSNPISINLSQSKLSPPAITQQFYQVKNIHQKTELLIGLLQDKHIFKAIIFSATKLNAERLAERLKDFGYKAKALHGDLKQSARKNILLSFKKDTIQFLVATDLASRGIHVDDISHVINFDLPKFCEDYIHRIGRTGRSGKKGEAISFVLPADVRHVKRLEKYLGKKINFSRLPNHEISLDQVTDGRPFPKKDFKTFKKKNKKPFQSKNNSFESRKHSKKQRKLVF